MRNGWGDLVRGDLKVHEVPGDHNTILNKEYARVLGEKLHACLTSQMVAARHTENAQAGKEATKQP